VWGQDRREYVCRPGAGAVITPPFLGGFRIKAEIEARAGNDLLGIICAQRNYYGGTGLEGWACYVLRGNRLIVTFSAQGIRAGLSVDKVSLLGRHTVEMSYVVGADDEDGSIRVSVDGREEARCSVVSSAPWSRLRHRDARLCVGRDQGIPLSADYRSPFPFTGLIHRLVYTVPADAAGDPDRSEG
jgi:hypothetical protein